MLALCDIIWRAAEGGTAVICLPNHTPGFQHINGYNPDGFTEKVSVSEKQKMQNYF